MVVVVAVSIKKLFTVKYPNVFMFVVYDFYGGGVSGMGGQET